MKQNRRGFSLVELLVVVGLIGLLLILLTPTHGPRERGRRTWCKQSLLQIGLAINRYQSDHNGLDPTNVTDLIKYVGGDQNRKLFMCPSMMQHFRGEAPERITDLHAAPQFVGDEYLFCTSSVPDREVGATVNPRMCDKAGNHGTDGINILFADGHAAWWAGTIEEYGRSNSLTIAINTNWVK